MSIADLKQQTEKRLRRRGLRGLTATKKALCAAVLHAMGRAFELTSIHVPDAASLLSVFPEGYRTALGILPSGPAMTLEWSGGRIHYLGMELMNPDLSLLFMNLDSAILVFSGVCPAYVAAAERRIAVHGDNSEAIRFVAVMNHLQANLFPAFLFPHLFRNPPIFGPREKLVKARILGSLGPSILLGLIKQHTSSSRR